MEGFVSERFENEASFAGASGVPFGKLPISSWYTATNSGYTAERPFSLLKISSDQDPSGRTSMVPCNFAVTAAAARAMPKPES